MKSLIEKNDETNRKYQRLGENFNKLQEKYQKYKLAYTKAWENEKRFKHELEEIQSKGSTHDSKSRWFDQVYTSDKDIGPKLWYARTPT